MGLKSEGHIVLAGLGGLAVIRLSLGWSYGGEFCVFLLLCVVGYMLWRIGRK